MEAGEKKLEQQQQKMNSNKKLLIIASVVSYVCESLWSFPPSLCSVPTPTHLSIALATDYQLPTTLPGQKISHTLIFFWTAFSFNLQNTV